LDEGSSPSSWKVVVGFSAETERPVCVRALRADSLSGAATGAVLRPRSPIRKRNPGGTLPARFGDRLQKGNKGGVRNCRATTSKGAKESRARAKALFFSALNRIENWKKRKSVDTAG